jgi:pimeloyl-ACP methyl ester carboxylesterase
MAACIGPLDAPGSERGMAPLRRLALTLARRAPALATRASEMLFDPQRDVCRFYRAMVRGLAPVDRRILARPEIWSAQLQRVGEALRPGLRGFWDEVALAAEAWGFALESVRVPVRLWHGTHDRSTPLSMAQHMAGRLANAELTICEDEGHFLVISRADEILRWACS